MNTVKNSTEKFEAKFCSWKHHFLIDNLTVKDAY